MRKPIAILIMCCLSLSCGQNKNEQKAPAIEKPIQHFMSFRLVENDIVEYDIDTLANFSEVLKILNETDCEYEYAMFKLETQDTIYKIQPLQFCGILDYKLREIIYVNTDSITVNYELKYPIDSLKTVLANHLLNPKSDKNYPSTDEKKLISINVDSTKTMKETKELLLKIISDINELNSKANIAFMFEDRRIIQVIEK